MNASEIVYLLYTPHRSMPSNLPAVFKVAGGSPVSLRPGEFTNENEKVGNPVDVARASLVLAQHEKTVSLVYEEDVAKILAWREIVAKKQQEKAERSEKIRSRSEKEAADLAQKEEDLRQKQIAESFDASNPKDPNHPAQQSAPPAKQASRVVEAPPAPVSEESKKDGETK